MISFPSLSQLSRSEPPAQNAGDVTYPHQYRQCLRTPQFPEIRRRLFIPGKWMFWHFLKQGLQRFTKRNSCPATPAIHVNTRKPWWMVFLTVETSSFIPRPFAAALDAQTSTKCFKINSRSKMNPLPIISPKVLRGEILATRLSETEMRAVDAAAGRDGLNRSEWLRNAAIAHLHQADQPSRIALDSIVLAELMGMRLLILNLFAATNPGLPLVSLRQVMAHADSAKNVEAARVCAEGSTPLSGHILSHSETQVY